MGTNQIIVESSIKRNKVENTAENRDRAIEKDF